MSEPSPLPENTDTAALSDGTTALAPLAPAAALPVPTPPEWKRGEPHPIHGPVDLLPRDAEGRIPRYYYLSPDDIVSLGLAPPDLNSYRHDGFTTERQRTFIETLAQTASVSAAAKAAMVSRKTAYAYRNRADAHAFRAAWDEAVRSSIRVLADTAFERAVDGVEEAVYWKGEHVGFRRRYNDRLLMFLLRVRDPANFATLSDLGDWQQLRPLENAPAIDRAIERIEQGALPEKTQALLIAGDGGADADAAAAPPATGAC